MAGHVTSKIMIVALIIVAGVALALPVTPAFAEAGGPKVTGDNDAASGSDAGDTPEEALALPPNRRTWSANLTPTGTDADWYRIDTGAAFCAVVDATTNAPGLITLAGSTGLRPATSRQADPHTPTRLALAAPAGGSSLFGLEPPPMMLMASESSTAPSPGRYTFAMGASSYEQLDAQDDGENPEAGSSLATAAPLPADCAAGRLAGGGDASDIYYFDAAQGDVLGLSFAVARGDAAQARVVTPLGATYATLASGDAIDVRAGEAGRWSVVVERTTAATGMTPAGLTLLPSPFAGASDLLGSDYLLGTTDGPGDPAPCRPSCVG